MPPAHQTLGHPIELRCLFISHRYISTAVLDWLCYSSRKVHGLRIMASSSPLCEILPFGHIYCTSCSDFVTRLYKDAHPEMPIMPCEIGIFGTACEQIFYDAKIIGSSWLIAKKKY